MDNAFVYKLRESFIKTMTAIESIFEIKSAVRSLARFSSTRDPIVTKKIFGIDFGRM